MAVFNPSFVSVLQRNIATWIPASAISKPPQQTETRMRPAALLFCTRSAINGKREKPFNRTVFFFPVLDMSHPSSSLTTGGLVANLQFDQDMRMCGFEIETLALQPPTPSHAPPIFTQVCAHFLVLSEFFFCGLIAHSQLGHFFPKTFSTFFLNYYSRFCLC